MKNLFLLIVTASILALNGCQKEITETDQVTIPDFIIIGNQKWEKKNLDISVYRDGTPIPQVTDRVAWVNLKTGAWCWYNNDSVTYSAYGKLYNWYAVNDSRGLAPAGWHVPSDDELTILANYLGGDALAGGLLKEKGTAHWQTPNQGATDSSGFSGLPAGHRDPDGNFGNIGTYGSCWSATRYDATLVNFRYMDYNSQIFTFYQHPDNYGLSVRCIKE